MTGAPSAGGLARVCISILCGAALLHACDGAAPPVCEPTPSVAPSSRSGLLDRQLFAVQPGDLDLFELSPDGRYVSFVKVEPEGTSVWVLEVGQPMSAARPLVLGEGSLHSVFWALEGHRLIYETDGLFIVDPDAPPAEGGVPPARNLLGPDRALSVSFDTMPRDEPNRLVVYVYSENRDERGYYWLHLDDGLGERILPELGPDTRPVFDERGEPRVALSLEPPKLRVLRLVDGRLGEELYSLEGTFSSGIVGVHPDGRRLYVASDLWTDLESLFLVDLVTGGRELVASDPKAEVDLWGSLRSRGDGDLLATSYRDDRVRWVPHDMDFARDLAAMKRRVPPGDLIFMSHTRDRGLWILKVQRDVEPGVILLYDREQRRAEELYRRLPRLPRGELAPKRAVRYRARDGLSIHAYLTLPPGRGETLLPTVIMPHGGPNERSVWGFDSLVQLLADRGYAVLQPNFRGSSGYGSSFREAGRGQWGKAMQDDLTDGVAWLVDRCIADPQRVAIVGLSYGGYAAMAGLAFTPELYAAGVSINGVSDLTGASMPIARGMLLDSPRGDPTEWSFRQRLELVSPLHAAANIRAPLLLMHGHRDLRVGREQSQRMVRALDDLGRPVEYYEFESEGHELSRESWPVMAAAVERFLGEHLGVRHQTTMVPEVAERLEAARVEPASVVIEE